MAQRTAGLNGKKTKIRNSEFDFQNTRYIMGILNITPDSFSDGGKYLNIDEAVKRTGEMIAEGAEIIDIGAESSRPGAEPLPLDEELERIIPVIKAIRSKYDVVLSVDTYKSEVADMALSCGADIINDISGLNADPEMAKVIAKHGAWAVLMHMKGTPKTMQQQPHYEDVVAEVIAELKTSIDEAIKNGVNSDKIIIDPGIGFGKTFEHNIEIIKNLKRFKSLGYPILMGVSRKSFIGKILDADIGERKIGSIAAALVSVINGASILRVHDVKETYDAVKILNIFMFEGGI